MSHQNGRDEEPPEREEINSIGDVPMTHGLRCVRELDYILAVGNRGTIYVAIRSSSLGPGPVCNIIWESPHVNGVLILISDLISHQNIGFRAAEYRNGDRFNTVIVNIRIFGRMNSGLEYMAVFIPSSESPDLIRRMFAQRRLY